MSVFCQHPPFCLQALEDLVGVVGKTSSCGNSFFFLVFIRVLYRPKNEAVKYLFTVSGLI